MPAWSRPGVSIADSSLRAFARRHQVRRLAVFGSALRNDVSSESDVDLLVEFEKGRAPGLLTVAAMELELGELLGRDVDLRTFNDLSQYFRDQVATSARELHAS